MRKALLIVSVAVFGLSFGCGGKDAKDKPATAAVAPDTVAAVPDTAAVAVDTVATVPDTTAFAPDTDTTYTDKRDGKVYKIVKIGGQYWFAENLNYAAGGSKCYENSEDSCAKYGRLYNWETALKACPAGFHLPDVKEWTMLEKNAGGVKKAGTKLKSSTGWERYKNVPAGTDEYGFSALPGGIGVFVGNAGNGEFKSSGEHGGWWTAKGISHDPILYRIWYWDYSPLERDNAALNRYMMAYEEPISRNYHHRTHTYISVRCVMDKEAQK